MRAIVKLVLDSVTATCPECGHPHFRPPTLRELAGRSLTCSNCGARVAYGALLQQIVRSSDDPKSKPE